jgi:hypothetical protein
MKHRVLLSLIACALIVACGKKEEAAVPAAPPVVAPAAPDKSKDDLARIRELMEKEEARKQEQEAKAKRLAKSQMDGATAPLQTFGR